MVDKKQDRKKILVIIISIVLHLIVLALFLINNLQESSKQKIAPKQKKPTAAPIFFQGMKQSAPTMPQKNAVLKKEPQKEEAPPKPQKPIIQEKKETKISQINKQAKPDTKDQKIKVSETREKPEKAQEKIYNKPEHKKLTLADFSKGFLHYAKKNGANLVRYTKSMKGTPTAEQLKHERYIQKIFQQIETSLKIKKREFALNYHRIASDFFVLDINLLLNQNGHIDNITLTKSSGFHDFDNFMLSVLRDAGSSFPPLPKYFNVENYLLPVRFHIPIRLFTRRG